MIQYCAIEWTQEIIRSDNLFWPMFGSFEGWICQALNVYVNTKNLFARKKAIMLLAGVGFGHIRTPSCIP